ncbi:MAG: phage Gp37/Gp68 family protein [Gemmatimonadaceae bacterium]|nr:phage Gp37/Gp68 family protein [Gemmatimonadaceae bacterium]
MGDRTGIEWTDRTWNPWYGCTKVSAGCDHCYMFRDQERRGQIADVVARSKTTFRDPLTWKDPARVFSCSWSDWFHRDADPWRAEAWAIIRATPHLTYQILTKRPGRIARHLPKDWGDGYPNVWLGVSLETQGYASRLAVLADIPARVRFMSAEPLLSRLTLDAWLPGFHWVIAGGESGPGARPMALHWVRRLRDDCAFHGVPFFLKQLGGHPDARAHEKAVLDGRRHTEMPRA